MTVVGEAFVRITPVTGEFAGELEAEVGPAAAAAGAEVGAELGSGIVEGVEGAAAGVEGALAGITDAAGAEGSLAGLEFGGSLNEALLAGGIADDIGPQIAAGIDGGAIGEQVADELTEAFGLTVLPGLGQASEEAGPQIEEGLAGGLALGDLGEEAGGDLGGGILDGSDPGGTGKELGEALGVGIAGGAGGGDIGKRIASDVGDGADPVLKSRGSALGGQFAKQIIGGAAAIGAGKFLADSIQEATNLDHLTQSVNLLFGNAATGIESLGKNSAQTLGQSNVEVLQASVNYGNLLRSLGFTQTAAAGVSTELIKVATDLASVRNVPVSSALSAIQSGLSGISRPLRQFGIDLSASRLAEEATSEGLITKGQTLEGAAKAQAAYSLIVKESSIQQGNFANTADTTANKQKILTAEIQNEKAALGHDLMPAYRDVLAVGGSVLELFEALPGPVQIGIIALVGLTGALKVLAPSLNLIQTVGQKTLDVLRGVRGATGAGGNTPTPSGAKPAPSTGSDEGSAATGVAQGNQAIAASSDEAVRGVQALEAELASAIVVLRDVEAELLKVAAAERDLGESGAGVRVTPTGPTPTTGTGVPAPAGDSVAVRDEATAERTLADAGTDAAAGTNEASTAVRGLTGEAAAGTSVVRETAAAVDDLTTAAAGARASVAQPLVLTADSAEVETAVATVEESILTLRTGVLVPIDVEADPVTLDAARATIAATITELQATSDVLIGIAPDQPEVQATSIYLQTAIERLQAASIILVGTDVDAASLTAAQEQVFHALGRLQDASQIMVTIGVADEGLDEAIDRLQALRAQAGETSEPVVIPVEVVVDEPSIDNAELRLAGLRAAESDASEPVVVSTTGGTGGPVGGTATEEESNRVAAANTNVAESDSAAAAGTEELGAATAKTIPELEAEAAALRDVALAGGEAATGLEAATAASRVPITPISAGLSGGGSQLAEDLTPAETVVPEVSNDVKGLSLASVGLGTAVTGSLVAIGATFAIYDAWSKNVQRVKDEEGQLTDTIVQQGDKVPDALTAQYAQILKSRGGFLDTLNKTGIQPQQITNLVNLDPHSFDEFRKVFQDQASESVSILENNLNTLGPLIPKTLRPFIDQLIDLHDAGTITDGDFRKIIDGATDLSKEATGTAKAYQLLGQRFSDAADKAGVNATVVKQLDVLLSDNTSLSAKQKALEELESEYPKIAKALGLIADSDPTQIFDAEGNAAGDAAKQIQANADALQKSYGVVQSAISGSETLTSARQAEADAETALAQARATLAGTSDDAISADERLANAESSLQDARSKQAKDLARPLAAIPAGETLADLTAEQQQTLQSQSDTRTSDAKAVASAEQNVGDAARARAKVTTDARAAEAKAEQDLADKKQAVVTAALNQVVVESQLAAALADDPGLIDKVRGSVKALVDQGVITQDEANAVLGRLGDIQGAAKAAADSINSAPTATAHAQVGITVDPVITNKRELKDKVTKAVTDATSNGQNVGIAGIADALSAGEAAAQGDTGTVDRIKRQVAETNAGVPRAQAQKDQAQTDPAKVESQITSLQDTIKKRLLLDQIAGSGASSIDIELQTEQARLKALQGLKATLDGGDKGPNVSGTTKAEDDIGNHAKTAKGHVDDLHTALKILGIDKPKPDIDTTAIDTKIEATVALLQGLRQYSMDLSSGNIFSAIGGLAVTDRNALAAGLTPAQIAAAGSTSTEQSGIATLQTSIKNDQKAIADDQTKLKSVPSGSNAAKALNLDIASKAIELQNLQALLKRAQGRSSGGQVLPGVPYTVNEAGLEPIFFGSGGQVLAAQTRLSQALLDPSPAVPGAGGQPVIIHSKPGIDQLHVHGVDSDPHSILREAQLVLEEQSILGRWGATDGAPV